VPLALVLAAAVVAATPPPLAPALITPTHAGKSFRLAKGRTVALRLPGGWAWSEPRPSTGAVQLTQLEFFVDPGYSEWLVEGRTQGTATIRSVGKAGCTDCGPRRFVVTIRVV
jgi:hypothetical protein